MKLLIFTDTHGDMRALKTLIKKSRDVDAVICAGDMSIFERNLKDIIIQFRKFKKPVFVIPGNHEGNESLSEVCSDEETIFNVHKAAIGMDNLLVVGHGGGGFVENSPEFRSISEMLGKQIQKHRKEYKSAISVLLTHQPPYNTKLDTIYEGMKTGNKDYRKFIRRFNPNLVVCGHIHETFGKKETLKNTLMMNPGPEGKIIEF
jgi:uncharacterized protein